jgi:hypothetical protein
MASNCIYRSVSLQAGESFTLPPGAEIVSATDINAITSTCPIPDNLESLECYIIVLLANVDNLTQTYVWEGCGNDCNAYMTSITVGGVTYTFPSAFTADDRGKFDVGGVASYIASTPAISGMMLSLGTNNDYDYPRGGVATLCFKTTPSIAAETYLTLTTSLLGLGTPEPVTTVRVYAQKLSDYSGGAGTCACAATT